MTDRRFSLTLCVALLLAALCGLFTSCLDLRDEAQLPAQDPCTNCHGSDENPGDDLQRSAPPRDLFGNESSEYPGVGAHALHLNGSATHAPIACTECHRVPDSVNEPGHADTARPAEVHFGSFSRREDASPHYDAATRRCSDSYCHGAYKPVWTHPKSSNAACGTCHGLPPPPPHPAAEQCSVCHGQVVDSAGQIIAPEMHVDGTLQVIDNACSDCHGSSDNAAPPRDIEGNSSRSSLGVGAHQAHLSGGASGRPLACVECHQVPSTTISEGHLDGAPAQVMFADIALAHDRSPSWDRETESCADTWCHNPGEQPSALSSPAWTDVSDGLPCDGCHQARPPAPHPVAGACADCHAGVSEDGESIVNTARHVNGIVDVNVPDSCTSCHGDMVPSPPPDLSGNDDTTAPGVGAHRAHLEVTGRSRPLACGECHVVPEATLDPGHLDSPPPAEVQFSGVALSFGVEPKYESGSCQESFCHSASIAGRFAGGTQIEPVWTEVDGSARRCTSCHALPPPAPHPENADDCSGCHRNIAADRTFIVPERHVDGIVTFFLTPQGL